MEGSLPINAVVAHTHTVVFLHGRGDNVRNFTAAIRHWINSEGQSLQEAYPSFRWIYPQAKTSALESDKSLEWPQWFDVWNVRDFTDREELQAEGLRKSVVDIRKVLEKEAALLDNQWDHIILAGISQGAATSIHTLLNLQLPSNVKGQRRLGAFLGFSCRLPFPGRSLAATRKILDLENVPGDNEVLQNTPIQLEHCVDDPLVLVEYGRNLQKSLQDFGARVSWKEYPNGGHWFNAPRGINDTIDFINQNVPGLPGSGPISDTIHSGLAMDLS